MATTKPFRTSRNSSTSNNIFHPTFFNFEIPDFENGKPILRLKKIWIFGSQESKQHYVRFYPLGMKNMFKIGDKVVKVEHFGTISRMLNWSLNKKSVWVRDNLENIDFALDSDKEKKIYGLYVQ
jgi:hypothetical protein